VNYFVISSFEFVKCKYFIKSYMTYIFKVMLIVEVVAVVGMCSLHYHVNSTMRCRRNVRHLIFWFLFFSSCVLTSCIVTWSCSAFALIPR